MWKEHVTVGIVNDIDILVWGLRHVTVCQAIETTIKTPLLAFFL